MFPPVCVTSPLKQTSSYGHNIEWTIILALLWAWPLDELKASSAHLRPSNAACLLWNKMNIPDNEPNDLSPSTGFTHVLYIHYSAVSQSWHITRRVKSILNRQHHQCCCSNDRSERFPVFYRSYKMFQSRAVIQLLYRPDSLKIRVHFTANIVLAINHRTKISRMFIMQMPPS